MPAHAPWIRDRLLIDQEVQDFYDRFTGDGPVYLLGREVTHAQTLRVGARPLVIVADTYDGTGGMIDASGSPGAAGSPGANGHGIGVGGDAGGTGGPGGPGGTVTIHCRRSVNAHVTVSGGPGGPGGQGGDGTSGTPDTTSAAHTEWVDDTPGDPYDDVGHEVEVPEVITPGVVGGRGGRGGTGGAGGPGGAIVFTSTTDDTPPTLEAAGGWGRPGGWGGTGGMYAPTEDDGSTTAAPGPDGEWGAAGQVTLTTTTEDEHVAGLRPLLGVYANYWAPYRLLVGEHYYSARDDRAAVEIARTLELQPDNADALRLQGRLESGVNALGLPPDLDVIPDFESSISAFTGFGAMALSFLTAGTDQIVDALTLHHLASFSDLMRAQAVAARDNAEGALGVARTEQQLAADEADHARQRLDQASADIEAAVQEMQKAAEGDTDVFGTLIEVGMAVAAVVAAVPTGGASLVTLVPAIVGLADTVLDDAGPAAKAFLAGDKADLSDIEAAYKRVDKAAPAVVKGVGSIVNFVRLVERLTASRTPDTAKYVDLVRRGAETAHEVLLAQRRADLAQQQVDAVQQQVARADGVAARAADLRDTVEGDAGTLREAGLLAVATAQACAAPLLALAFRAQRAVEIYTLQDESANLPLDAGLVHPDLSRAYDEGQVGDAALVAAITASWSTLMRPVALQNDYTSYFDNAPDRDQLRLTFAADSPEVRSLRDSCRFAFRVDVDDLPAGRYDTKVEGVRIAVVGAAHPNGELSVALRHGARYEQRRPDGSVAVQLLAAKTSTRKALLTPLPPDPGFTPDPPLTAPTSLRVWGRGLGGDWELSIPEDQQPGLDLSGVTAVQVWLGYRFLG